MRAGVIHNRKSHQNRTRPAAPHPDALFASPHTVEELTQALARFRDEKVELVIIDGGDGTVRDLITALPGVYGAAEPPLLSVVASGKTNVLAFDLGVRDSWTVDAALRAVARDGFRVRIRTPLEVDRGDGLPHRGFVFGAAGLVRGIDLAQGFHRSGVFRNAAVGLTLAGAVWEVAAGDDNGAWRRGDPISLSIDDGPVRQGPRLVTMASTLERLPFALRPFGPARHGLKFLDIDAPPRRFAGGLPRVLWSRDDRWLAANGYRRGDAKTLRFSLDTRLVLDGEIYPGGEFSVTEGAPLRFLTP